MMVRLQLDSLGKRRQSAMTRSMASPLFDWVHTTRARRAGQRLRRTGGRVPRASTRPRGAAADGRAAASIRWRRASVRWRASGGVRLPIGRFLLLLALRSLALVGLVAAVRERRVLLATLLALGAARIGLAVARGRLSVLLDGRRVGARPVARPLRVLVVAGRRRLAVGRTVDAPRIGLELDGLGQRVSAPTADDRLPILVDEHRRALRHDRLVGVDLPVAVRVVGHLGVAREVDRSKLPDVSGDGLAGRLDLEGLRPGAQPLGVGEQGADQLLAVAHAVRAAAAERALFEPVGPPSEGEPVPEPPPSGRRRSLAASAAFVPTAFATAACPLEESGPRARVGRRRERARADLRGLLEADDLRLDLADLGKHHGDQDHHDDDDHREDAGEEGPDQSSPSSLDRLLPSACTSSISERALSL